MAYRLVCDKCGSEINPASSKIVIGYNTDSLGTAKEEFELCASCARRLKQWINCPPVIINMKEGGGEDG